MITVIDDRRQRCLFEFQHAREVRNLQVHRVQVIRERSGLECAIGLGRDLETVVEQDRSKRIRTEGQDEQARG